MKRLTVIGFLLLATGCAAVVTPHGTYLEPLPLAVTVAPSVVAVEPPPYVVERVRPLPEVYVYPDRPIYSYGGLYYHYWNGGWYYGQGERGPWHSLPRTYYPRHMYRR